MTVPLQPKARDDLIVREVAEDFVVYDPVKDYTALLNQTAAIVLEFCDGTMTADKITQEIASVFGVKIERVAPDVDAALKEFATHGFFQPANESPL